MNSISDSTKNNQYEKQIPRILVVDDETDIAELVCAILEDEVLEVHTANNRREALELLVQHQFDVMLCDVYLKTESGLKLIGDALRHDPKMLVIVMTGYASVEILLDAIKVGAYDFVNKPFQNLDLLNAINRAIEKKRLSEHNDLLINELRQEKLLLEERVKEATLDVREKMGDLKQLNEQLSTIMGLTLDLPEDSSIFNTLKTVSQRLKETLPFEECFCILYHVSNGQITLDFHESDRGRDLNVSVCEALKTISSEYLKELQELTNYNDRVVKLRADLMSKLVPPNGTMQIYLFPIISGTQIVGAFGISAIEFGGFGEVEESLVGLAISQIIKAYDEMNYLARASQLVTLGKLIGEIAHDLRHPLTSMKGSCQLLRDRWFEDELRERTVKNLLEDMSQMEHLVTELKDFGRPKVFETSTLELSAVIQKSLQICGQILKKKSIELEVLDEEESVIVQGSSRPLIEAFVNLIMNSAQAMDENGKLIIELNEEPESQELIKSGVDQERSFACVRVKDDGCGIAPEDLDKVFKRFYTTKTEGTGLGLSAVNRILKQNLGGICIASTKGKGTVVSVLLPKL